VLLNIGGIANLTFIPAGASMEQLIAFDIGPGNCISDSICRDRGPFGMSWDIDGAGASRGQVIQAVVKRALTDPHTFAGIGNAYSDEILHRAKLSPLATTQKLTPEAVAGLYTAAREVLAEWRARLTAEAAGGFPEKVTAFRDGMAVHGRFGKPCPACGAPVQRIVYAENECNYCARCQTGGRILADRALSRLLHASFPRVLDDGG